MLVVTPLYAGLIALLFVALSLRVVRMRRTGKVSLGDGGNAELHSRIRAQANCAEYAPIALLLLAMAELQGMPGALAHLFGASLFLGRVLHAWGLSNTPQVMGARIGGMTLTFVPIALLAIANIGHALF